VGCWVVTLLVSQCTETPTSANSGCPHASTTTVGHSWNFGASASGHRQLNRMDRMYSAPDIAMAFRPTPHLVSAFEVSALFCLLCVASAGQTPFATNPTRFVVCDKGSGAFNGKLPKEAPTSGVTVSVGPAKKNGFAAHACQAKLSWDGQETVVASEVSQADIDVMGADLGLGSLVVALQTKATEADPLIKYEIYSLSGPPQLLRTITGEDYFSAADTRLDQSVEIWTTDAAAVNGFEKLPLRAFDFAPTVVLRFEDKKLIDVSSEFRPHFDRQIELLRSQLDTQQLSDFKKSDGKLSNDLPPAKDRPHGQLATQILATKIKVLEIVWCYLYSGREQEAWNALAEMWPPADLDRIRTAILNAQSHGMRTQVDGVSHKSPPHPSNHSYIYSHIMPAPSEYGVPSELRARLADAVPQRLVWMVAPPHDPEHWAEGRKMELVIDEAGKVRSAKLKEGKEEPNKDWIDATAGWKYIPAYKDGHPTAFRLDSHVRRNQ
jgi:hypothetical protein